MGVNWNSMHSFHSMHVDQWCWTRTQCQLLLQEVYCADHIFIYCAPMQWTQLMASSIDTSDASTCHEESSWKTQESKEQEKWRVYQKAYLPRQSRSVVCKNCTAVGHNRRTCKGKTTADRTIPKGGSKNLKRQSPCPTHVATKKQNTGPSSSQTPSTGHQRGDNTSETQQSQIS